jgi:hypothetical protein
LGKTCIVSRFHSLLPLISCPITLYQYKLLKMPLAKEGPIAQGWAFLIQAWVSIGGQVDGRAVGRMISI